MRPRFGDLAERAFAFLSDAGFQLTRSDPHRLLYESSRSFVDLDWDDRSGEIGVWVGLIGASRHDTFSLTDLLDMLDVDVPARVAPLHAMDEDRLTSCLQRLAADTQAYAGAALAGDPEFFRSLGVFRTSKAVKLTKEYEKGHEQGLVKAAAEQAWRDHAFDTVAHLFGTIEHDLTASERGKLTYARRQIAKSGQP